MKKLIIPTLLLIGLSLLLYPSLSNYWNGLHQSQAIVDYAAALQEMAQADYSVMFAEAEQYNRDLKQISYPLMNHTQLNNYHSVLNLGGTGIMGYISIPKLQVELPIYHGTAEPVLQVAVGHLEGTSLPIGGIGNHSVLSAHSGLPRAKLFTDLNKMEIGDTFSITVLDRELTYQVDQILVVEPRDVEALYPVEGRDLCTLITCTPYGINSHRLLVRGHRVENGVPRQIPTVTADAIQLAPPVAAAILASPFFLLLLIALVLPYPIKTGGMIMRKGLLLICVLFLAIRCVLPASAAEEGGSIRLSLPGGNLYLYPVAEIRITDDEETYIPGPEFADFHGILTDLSSPSLAEELAGYALEHSCFCLAAEAAKDGNILFSGLKPGLYLLVQTEAAPGYETMAPFLVFLPDGENEPVHMDANPKFQLTPLPTQPLPSLPQTGQINWPIPILCSSGILLFLIGLFLQRRRHG